MEKNWDNLSLSKEIAQHTYIDRPFFYLPKSEVHTTLLIQHFGFFLCYAAGLNMYIHTCYVYYIPTCYVYGIGKASDRRELR